jgi:hypothetical protein
MDIGYLLRDIESNQCAHLFLIPSILCNRKFDIN